MQSKLVAPSTKNYTLQERIMMGGHQGSGKTYDWLCIARALPEVKFYVIDPDDGVRRVWYTEFPEVHNITYYFTPTWFTTDYADYKKNGPKAELLLDGSGKKSIFHSGIYDAWNLFSNKIRQGDWVVVEHLHLIWDLIQETFADEVFNKNIGDYFLERRKAMADSNSKKLEALEGWTDWSVINKMHNADFINKVCYQNPGHVFMTTSISMVDSNAKEEIDVKAFYGDTSIRFDGQKKTPFKTQTMLIKRQSGSGTNRKYIINTLLKDRGRTHLEKYEITDFYYDYLVGIAGL